MRCLKGHCPSGSTCICSNTQARLRSVWRMASGPLSRSRLGGPGLRDPTGAQVLRWWKQITGVHTEQHLSAMGTDLGLRTNEGIKCAGGTTRTLCLPWHLLSYTSCCSFFSSAREGTWRIRGLNERHRERQYLWFDRAEKSEQTFGCTGP